MRISDWSSDVCSSDLIMSSTAEIAVDEDHRELHRVGRAAIRLFELRLAVSPDAADLLGQFGRKVHLLRDDRVPTSCLAKTLAKLRFHRRALGAVRFVACADPVQHPGSD